MINNDETLYTEATMAGVPHAADAGADVAASDASGRSKNSSDWRTVMIGGVAGVVMGSASALFTGAAVPEIVEAMNDGDSADAATGTSSLVSPNATVDVATTVTDDMSFGEAFAAARHEVGAGGVFVWHGNVYNTYTAEEWQSMSADDRTQFAHQVSGTPMPTYLAHNDGHHTPTPDPVVEPASGSGLDIDVISVGVEEVDGRNVTVAHAHVDGHDALLIDADQDGTIDGMMVDLNDDGQISESEMLNIEAAGVTFADLGVADVPGSDIHLAQNDPYSDMPDYTNDADVSSFA